MNQKNLKYVLCLFFILSNSIIFANKTPPLPKGSGTAPPVGLPIDGGLSYLIIAGLAYGVYELKKKK
tara:strand:- start:14087 stop:14287 length:201 start_codon:yes stop_codon:yes gene_type:complete